MSEPKKTRGRPSSFNRADVIQQIMPLFWERGYHDISFNEISQETGLTRASLYNAFGTKESLFLEVLDAYFQEAPDHLLREVKEESCVGETLLAVLNNAAHMYSRDPKKRGCLSVNCMNELMGGDDALNLKVNTLYQGYKTRLKALIEQAIRQEELPKDTDSETTANMIFTFMNGLSVFSKSDSSEIQMNNMAQTFLKNLGFNL